MSTCGISLPKITDVAGVGEPLKSQKLLFKVVLLGDSGVGKTSIINQFVKHEFHESCKTTIGADFFIKQITVDGQVITLQIWDTAGMDRFHSLCIAFYRGADACLLVFDVNDVDSFEHLTRWRDEFVSRSQCNPYTFPFVVIGNKIDEERPRQVPENRILQWCRQNGDLRYFETSAKANVNIQRVFQDVGKLAIQSAKENSLSTLVENLKSAELPEPLNLLEASPTSSSQSSCC